MGNAEISVLRNSNGLEQKSQIYSHLLYLPGKMRNLEKLGELVFFPKQQIVLEGNKLSPYCYMVKKGRVISYELYANGEERIYHFHEEGALFLEENVLFGQITPLSFRTASNTELIRISKSNIMRAIREDSDLALDIIEASSAKFHSAMMLVRHGRNYSIAWKICDLFLSFVEYSGVPQGNKMMIKEKLSQQTISNLLGINRVTTVRAIKELKDLGLIEQKKGLYYINDVERLIKHRESLDKNI